MFHPSTVWGVNVESDFLVKVIGEELLLEYQRETHLGAAENVFWSLSGSRLSGAWRAGSTFGSRSGSAPLQVP